MTPPQQAYFLVGHGSRDPRSQQALEQWAIALRQRLALSTGMPADTAPVQLGTLEFAEHPLEQQLIDFAHQVKAQGICEIAVLPLFLLAGVHVQVDIPAAVTSAQRQLGASVRLRLCSHLGSHPHIAEVLRQNMQGIAAEHWILLSHGTRRAAGQSAVEALATQLGVVTAYWSVSPDLDARLSQIHAVSCTQRIGILPYFVVSGGILDAISTKIYTLKSKFNKFSFTIAPTLQPNALAINFLIDLCSFNTMPYSPSLIANL